MSTKSPRVCGLPSCFQVRGNANACFEIMRQVEGEATPPDAQTSPFHLYRRLLLPFCLHKSTFTFSETLFTSIPSGGLKITKISAPPKTESSQTFHYLAVPDNYTRVKTSRLKSTISAAETPEFLTFSGSYVSSICILYYLFCLTLAAMMLLTH